MRGGGGKDQPFPLPPGLGSLPARPLAGYVNVGRLLHFSELGFPHLSMGWGC